MRIGKKTIWTLMLAVLVVMLSFGSAWAGTVTIRNTQIAGDENNGAFEFDGNTTAAAIVSTDVFFVPTTTGKITVKFDLNVAFTTNLTGDVDFDLVLPPTGWALTSQGTAVTMTGGAFSSDETVVLERTGTTGFRDTETLKLILLIESSGTPEEVTVTVKVTPKLVPLNTVPLQKLTMYNGGTYVTGDKTATVTPVLTGTENFAWTGIALATSNDIGTGTINDGDPIATGTGIAAKILDVAPMIDLTGTAAKTMDTQTYYRLLLITPRVSSILNCSWLNPHSSNSTSQNKSIRCV